MRVQLNILIISTNEEALEVLLRLVNKQTHWNGFGAKTSEEAKGIFSLKKIDLVLFNVGICSENEQNLIQFFNAEKEDVIIIQHYGGGSGLLYNEIQYALENNGKSCQFIDAAFNQGINPR